MRLLLLLTALAVLPAPAGAQGAWGVGIEAGIVRYWGASRPLPGVEDIALRPYRPTVFGIRADRALGQVRAALALRFAQSAIGGEYEGGATIFSDAFTLIEVAPEASVPLAQLGTGAAFRIFAGPVVTFWTLSDEAGRTRLGARGGLELEAPLAARVSAVTRLHGGIAASAFDAEEVPPGYEVRSMPSAGVSLGVRIGV